MSNQKTKLCKTCQKEIPNKAQICIHCGVKIKKPFYKRVWFIGLVAVIAIGIIAGTGNDNEPTSSPVQSEQKEIIYTPYDVSELMTDLKTNALNAETKYNNQYVEITGQLDVIDSDGSYISLSPANDPFAILGVQCYIKSDEQKARVAQMSKDDIITLRGKITSVGEVFGYSLNIDSID